MRKAKSDKSWDKKKVKQQITNALTVVDTVKNILGCKFFGVLWQKSSYVNDSVTF